MADASEIVSPSELKENARNVMASVAFARWKEIITAQIEGRKNEASVTPMKSLDDALERNFSNGEIAGMLMAFKMWDLMVLDAETSINRSQEEVE